MNASWIAAILLLIGCQTAPEQRQFNTHGSDYTREMMEICAARHSDNIGYTRCLIGQNATI